MFDYKNYELRGDKKNSDFFNEYLDKVYERRQTTGLEELFGHTRSLVLQVETGDAFPYMLELYMSTPYRLKKAYVNATHKIYVLCVKPEYPYLTILEPLSTSYVDDLTRLNWLYPLSRKKPNARYVGEVYDVKDKDEVRKILEAQSIEFCEEPGFYNNSEVIFTQTSHFSRNRIGYTAKDFLDLADSEFGNVVEMSAAELEALDKVDQHYHDLGFHELIRGVDHAATRMLAGDREQAILEFLTCTNYYYWGAYNIDTMNSSTNVTRNPAHAYNEAEHEMRSPAKVFTANNIPAFLNSFKEQPMPTETFVLNYGRRMHHVAYEVRDGDHASGVKNIDYVVGKLKEEKMRFLAHVVGVCAESPDLKQIFSHTSQYSILITEYVERCHGFDGFFTKSNVAALTAAAGVEESKGADGPGDIAKSGVYD